MTPFATVPDLEDRWRDLDPDEDKRAETLLGDASAIIASELARSGVTVNQDDELQLDNLRVVCCSMVQRVMNVTDELVGVAQYSQGAGPFTRSMTAANPNGDLYMTSKESKRLGIGKGRIGSIRPLIGVADDAW